MKTTINVSVDIEPLAELQRQGANVSAICNQALKEAAVLPEEESDLNEIEKELAILLAKKAAIVIAKARQEKAAEVKEADIRKAVKEAYAKRQRQKP